MFRLVRELRRLIDETIASGRDGWNTFFFKPADPTSVGVIRLICGGLALWSMLTLGLDLRDYLGSNGWADPRVVVATMPSRAGSFWLWVPDSLLFPMWGCCVVVLFAYTLGLWSRGTAVLAWLITIGTARRVPIMVHGFDSVLTTWLFYLAVTGASGQAVSLDRFLARWRKARHDLVRRPTGGVWIPESGVPRPTVSANIALRLIQIHLAVIYGTAGLAKLRGDAWWSGSAMALVLMTPEFHRIDFTWLVRDFPMVVQFGTLSGVGLEIAYPFLIWNRRLRPWILLAMGFMHLGIEAALGLTEFGITMAAANLSFVSGTWLRRIAVGDNQPAGKVLYDGYCPRCRASMAFLCSADPDHLIEPIDLNAADVSALDKRISKEAALKAMHIIDRKGNVSAGYDAVMALLSWIPAGRPLALIRYIPGVSWVGRRVYNTIASSRPRDVPCTDDVCGIHPPNEAKAKPKSADGLKRESAKGKSS